MTRIEQTFQALRAAGRKGLVTYVTAGDPDLQQSADVIRGIARGGADVLEIGVPFSDPIADGPAIQRASERALAAGAGLRSSLDMIGRLRHEIDAPIVIFTYVNPVLRMGVEAFISQAADAGVDGVLLLDLPIEESEDMRGRLDRRDIDQIFLVSPTTTDERLGVAGRLGRGFLYAISRLGVTGARETVAGTAAPLVERLRAATSLPIALGFGISRPEHVAQVWSYADAAVVGSALVDVVAGATAAGNSPAEAAEQFVRWLKEPGARG